MLKKLLIATHNQAKIEEIFFGLKKLFKENKLKITLLTLNDVGVENEVDETGKTFMENSILKAKYYGKITDLPTIADDGGLIIPYLKNEPGVKSNRWLGYRAPDIELINYTLKRLNNIPIINRTAYLKITLSFFHPKKQIIKTQTETIKGYIGLKPSNNIKPGYPFRSLFIVNKFNKYYDELTEEEHLKINHRLIALKKLFHKIKNML